MTKFRQTISSTNMNKFDTNYRDILKAFRIRNFRKLTDIVDIMKEDLKSQGLNPLKFWDNFYAYLKSLYDDGMLMDNEEIFKIIQYAYNDYKQKLN